jgi:AraC-like DNA-binding protein
MEESPGTNSAMRHLFHKPPFPLSQYVDVIWRVGSQAEPTSRRCIYPDGAMALVIHLKRPAASWFIDGVLHRIAVPLVAGPYSRSFHVDPSQPGGSIVARFRPGAAPLFFPIAAHELHNSDIALSELNPGEADQLLNEVCAAPDARTQIHKVEEYLMQKLVKAEPMHAAIGHAVGLLSREGGAGTIHRVQQEVGLSHTRFIQIFREHVGLTPKLFHRVRRFRRVLDHIGKGKIVSWADLASEFEYFDQAHFIREFRAFAGTTPGEYCRQLANLSQRVPARAVEISTIRKAPEM